MLMQFPSIRLVADYCYPTTLHQHRGNGFLSSIPSSKCQANGRQNQEQQITFPVCLYNPHLIQRNVIKEFDGTNIRELAKKYYYSEKTIRRMIRDSVEDVEEGEDDGNGDGDGCL